MEACTLSMLNNVKHNIITTAIFHIGYIEVTGLPVRTYLHINMNHSNFASTNTTDKQ